MKRMILEMGMGNDLYGQDYTKAALRAVEDAYRHSTLSIFKSLDLDPALMQVNVTVGVQEPDKVDTDKVAASLPRGKATVTVVKGGQNVADPDGGFHVIATAAVEATYPLEDGEWVLSQA